MKGVERKKGQVTIFVIIALVIIVFGTLMYFFYPGINSSESGIDENPRAYMQNCVEDLLQEKIDLISSQGGSIEPDSSYTYDGEPIEYLCYTSRLSDPCTVQRAFLVSHIESEIKESTEDKVNECFTKMESDYRARGYTLTLNRGNLRATLAPGRAILFSDSRLTLTKDSTQNYESFDIVVNNNLFELASLARTVIDWESTYGIADPFYFMTWYKDKFNIKKVSPDGGKTAIWTIEDTNSGDTFRFAVTESEISLGIGI
ncbi:MAG: hypothetical protein NUV46_00970 [Nanoarchaeota archaeon]|nr:hypothetical protein [Nanoarchaeota archaeon]